MVVARLRQPSQADRPERRLTGEQWLQLHKHFFAMSRWDSGPRLLHLACEVTQCVPATEHVRASV